MQIRTMNSKLKWMFAIAMLACLTLPSLSFAQVLGGDKDAPGVLDEMKTVYGTNNNFMPLGQAAFSATTTLF